MKKIVLCILILFFTSACSVEYSIELSPTSVLEEMKVVEYDSTRWDQPIFDSPTIDSYIDFNMKQYISAFQHVAGDPYDLDHKVDGVSYYTMNEISNKNRKGIQYSYEYSLENYKDSTFLNQCFDLVNIQMSGTVFTFSTSRDFRCFDSYKQVDSFSIHIKTDYKMMNHNASRVDGNTYIWNITPDVVNEPIQFQVNFGEIASSHFGMNDMLVFAIILIVSCLVGYIIYKVVTVLQNKNNKI